MILKKLCAFLAVTLIAGLTSCTANENITPNNSVSVVATTESVKATFSSQTAAITETASEITAEQKTNYSGFALKDYCTEFDNIEFVNIPPMSPKKLLITLLNKNKRQLQQSRKAHTILRSLNKQKKYLPMKTASLCQSLIIFISMMTEQ